MRRASLITALALGLGAAPAHAAGWSPPLRVVAGSQASGLEPTGTAGGYWMLAAGQGRAEVFELTPRNPPSALGLLSHPTATAVLAGDGRGAIVAAGEDGSGEVRVQRRERDGDVVDGTAPLRQVRSAAVNAGGDTAVGNGADLAYDLVGGSWTGPFPVTGDTAFAADVAVAADGTVDYVAATDGDLRLWERRPDGATTTTTLASYEVARADAVPAVSVATGPERALAIVWTQPAAPGSSRVRATLFARTRDDHGRLGPLQTVDTSRGSDLSPQVAITPAGRAVATWLSSHASRGKLPPRAVRSAFSAVGPGWFGPPVDVSSFGHVAGGLAASQAGRDAGNADLAIDGAGRAIVAWSSSCRGCDTKIAVSAATPKGRFGRQRILSRLGTAAEQPFVALDGHGGAAVTWTDRRVVTHAGPVAVFARAGALPHGRAPHDVRPPRARLRVLRPIRGGVLRVAVDCREPCAAQINAAGAIGATGTHGTARLTLAGRRPGSAGYTVTDRAGNITYGRLRIHE